MLFVPRFLEVILLLLLTDTWSSFPSGVIKVRELLPWFTGTQLEHTTANTPTAASNSQFRMRSIASLGLLATKTH